MRRINFYVIYLYEDELARVGKTSQDAATKDFKVLPQEKRVFDVFAD